MKLVEKLIKAGASLDMQDTRGFTALMCGAYNGHAEIVEVLTNAGASLDLVDRRGTSALVHAFGHRNIVHFLEQVKAGAVHAGVALAPTTPFPYELRQLERSKTVSALEKVFLHGKKPPHVTYLGATYLLATTAIA